MFLHYHWEAGDYESMTILGMTHLSASWCTLPHPTFIARGLSGTGVGASRWVVQTTRWSGKTRGGRGKFHYAIFSTFSTMLIRWCIVLRDSERIPSTVHSTSSTILYLIRLVNLLWTSCNFHDLPQLCGFPVLTCQGASQVLFRSIVFLPFCFGSIRGCGQLRRCTFFFVRRRLGTWSIVDPSWIDSMGNPKVASGSPWTSSNSTCDSIYSGCASGITSG